MPGRGVSRRRANQQANDMSLTAKLQNAASVQAGLDLAVDAFGAQSGTVHRFDAKARLLILAAQRNIPPGVVEVIGQIPIGKGLAGLAAQKREPVRICNLQTDNSGTVRPGARATGMEGAIAVPMLVAGEMKGVLGVAKAVAYDWTDAETQVLLEAASVIASRL